MTQKSLVIVLTAVAASAAACGAVRAGRDRTWTPEQVTEIRSLSLDALEPLTADPSNRVSGNAEAVAFGRKLFFDARLSSNGKVSCASCHDPNRGFQDGVPLSKGVGTTNRRAMPIAGTAHSPWMFWDGRKDSQWSQALGPLESGVEHGGTRAQYAHLIANAYRNDYEGVFGALPTLHDVPAAAGPVDDPAARAAWQAMPAAKRDDVTRVFVNIGKAIAAFERTIQHTGSRFDEYARALSDDGRVRRDVLSAEEVEGLRIFIGKGNCTQCHNGPLLTDNSFHNTGVPAVATLPEDRGRIEGARLVLADEFNCLSKWSDAAKGDCSELEFLSAGGHELERAMKAPSLRNVAERAPYMHAGQFRTLDDVIDHYNRAPRAPAGHSEIRPLKLNAKERASLAAYLRTLSDKEIREANRSTSMEGGR